MSADLSASRRNLRVMRQIASVIRGLSTDFVKQHSRISLVSWDSLDRANRSPAVAENGGHAVATRIVVKSVGAAVVVRIQFGRPVVAVRTGTFERSPVTVTGGGKEDTPIRVCAQLDASSLTCRSGYKSTFSVKCCANVTSVTSGISFVRSTVDIRATNTLPIFLGFSTSTVVAIRSFSTSMVR